MDYRDRLQDLIAALPDPPPKAALRTPGDRVQCRHRRALAGRQRAARCLWVGRTGADRPCLGRRHPRHGLLHIQANRTAMRYASVTDRLARLGGAKWDVHVRARRLKAAGPRRHRTDDRRARCADSARPDRDGVRGDDGGPHRLFQRPGRTGAAARPCRALYRPPGAHDRPRSGHVLSRHADHAFCRADGPGPGRRRGAGRRSDVCDL